MAEDSKFVEELRQDDPLLMILGAWVLFSIVFLQIQLYIYVLPKRLRNGFSLKRPTYDRDSFLKGSVGVGYLFVVCHIAMMVTDHYQGGTLLLGVLLIFFGTFSKIKTSIDMVLDENVQKNS